MGQVMDVSQIEKRVMQHIVQLESLAFSKNYNLMIKLNGHIEESVQVGGLTSGPYVKRISEANSRIMANREETPKVDLGGLAGLNVPEPLEATQITNLTVKEPDQFAGVTGPKPQIAPSNF
jgi:hypothetical protein